MSHLTYTYSVFNGIANCLCLQYKHHSRGVVSSIAICVWLLYCPPIFDLRPRIIPLVSSGLQTFYLRFMGFTISLLYLTHAIIYITRNSMRKMLASTNNHSKIQFLLKLFVRIRYIYVTQLVSNTPLHLFVMQHECNINCPCYCYNCNKWFLTENNVIKILRCHHEKNNMINILHYIRRDL